MIDRRIARYSLRRGLESERMLITPLTGELIYTTDKKRVYVGDGNLGGILISNKTHAISTIEPFYLSAYPEIVPGDLIFNQLTQVTYIATGSGNLDYTQIAENTSTDNLTLTSNSFNVYSVAFSGISSRYIHPSVASTGLTLDSVSGLRVNIDNQTLYIDSVSSLAVQTQSGFGIGYDNSGIFVKVDGTTVDFNANGELIVDLNSLALSGYDVTSTDGIYYTDVLNGSLTSRTFKAKLDNTTLALDNTGSIAVTSVPPSSVGRIECKDNIVLGGTDPISFNSLSGLYLDIDKLKKLFGGRIKHNKFSECTYAESANTLGAVLFLGDDGILRMRGRISDYDIVRDNYIGAGVGVDLDSVSVSVRNLPLNEDEQIDKFRIGYNSVWLLTDKGRMFFTGRNTSGSSGILSDSTVNESNNSADGIFVGENFSQNNKNFFIREYTEIPLSGAVVKDFRVATGGPTSNSYTPRVHVVAVASISGNSLFQTNSALSAFSHGSKTNEYIGLAWGCNLAGQLGNGQFTTGDLVGNHIPSILYDRTVNPIVPFSVKDIFPVSTRNNGSTYLIDSDDQVWATGANYARNLGVSSLSASNTSNIFRKCHVSPNATFSSNGIVTIPTNDVIPLKAESIMGSGHDSSDGGKYYTAVFALTAGQMYSCGTNAGYQLGNNRAPSEAETKYYPFLPIYLEDRATKLSDVVEMTMTDASNGGASVYARTNSKLYGWGRNVHGELGLGTTNVQQKFAKEITLSGASIDNIEKMEAYGLYYDGQSVITFTFLTTDGELYTCGRINKLDGSNKFFLQDQFETQYYSTVGVNTNTFQKIPSPTNKKWSDFRTYGANQRYYGAYIAPNWIYSPYQDFTQQYSMQTTLYMSTEDGDLYGWGSNIFKQIKDSPPYFRHIPTYMSIDF
jgi:alpha-tubulin suppressor-like RCC1 family protein